MATETPVKKGDRIRRIKDGRRFHVTLVNAKAGVFSAEPDDGEWSWWGGGLWQLVEGKTFDRKSQDSKPLSSS